MNQKERGKMNAKYGKTCEYAANYYGVPACIGRLVVVSGNHGVIAEDRGHYIGVLFDDKKPGDVRNCHPTDKVVYEGMGPIRTMTAAQERYRRYLTFGDGFDSFIAFCRWDYWQKKEERGVKL